MKLSPEFMAAIDQLNKVFQKYLRRLRLLAIKVADFVDHFILRHRFYAVCVYLGDHPWWGDDPKDGKVPWADWDSITDQPQDDGDEDE